MTHLKKHTVLALRVALRVARHEELRPTMNAEGMKFDEIEEDLAKFYDECGNYTGEANYVECPHCHEEFKAP